MRARVFIAGLLFLGILLIHQVYQALKFGEETLISQTFKPQTAVTYTYAQNFTHYIDRLVRELRNFAEDPDIIEVNDTGKLKLKTLQLARSGIVERVLRLDKNLRVIYVYPEDQEILGTDASFYEHNRKVRATGKVVLSKPFTTLDGRRGLELAQPVFKNGAFDGTISVMLDEKSLKDAFWLPLLGVSEGAYAALLDSDGSVFWSFEPAGAKKVAETHLTESEIETLRRTIFKSQGITPVLYVGRLPAKAGRWVAGIAPLKVADKDWYLLSAVPEASLRVALASYRMNFFVLGAVIVVIVVTLLAALLRAQRDSYIAKERAKMADEFEQKLDERTHELAEAKEKLATYAKNLEELVEERTRKLTQSEEMYRQLVENVGTIIFMLRGSKLAFVNPAFLSVWNEKKEKKDWLGKEVVLMVSPNSRPALLNALSELESDKEIVHFDELVVQENESYRRIWEGALKKVR